MAEEYYTEEQLVTCDKSCSLICESSGVKEGDLCAHNICIHWGKLMNAKKKQVVV